MPPLLLVGYLRSGENKTRHELYIQRNRDAVKVAVCPMAYLTLAYQCGLIIYRQHYGMTPQAATARWACQTQHQRLQAFF